MPLMKRSSKKAFEHNVKAEMEAHPGKEHRAQNLAIAFSVQRKAKKMAKGGMARDEHERGINRQAPKEGAGISEMGSNLNEPSMRRKAGEVLNEMAAMKKPKLKGLAEGGAVSAKSEHRPMPNEAHNDANDLHENRHSKPQTLSAAMEMRPMPKKGLRTMPIKHPRMVASNVLQSHLRDEEDHLQSSMHPESPEHQLEHSMDEEGADRHGPDTHDLHLKKMAEGGLAHGQDRHLMEIDSPSEDEGEMMAEEHDEEGQDRQGPESHDLHLKMMAEGGEADSMDQPEDEEELEHHASIAAAIMAKRKRMAEGGQVDIQSNAKEQPNRYYHQNEEVVLKENYDDDMDDLHTPLEAADMGDSREEDEENEHDQSIASKIRRQMSKRSPMTR